MCAAVLIAISRPVEANPNLGYAIGALIALIILLYLIYTLVKPEKF
jgi:K+-transporting ATPase KdpF subunit